MHFLLPAWLRHGRPAARPATAPPGAAASALADRAADAAASARPPPPAASIFSVDIQPFGPRVATAGQDAAVNVWSLDVLARLATRHGDDDDERDADDAHGRGAAAVENGQASESANKKPRGAPAESTSTTPPDGALLASVTGHSAAVNCVRWAPRGNLLASGGDDAVVLIYELSAGEARSAAFSGGTAAAQESWRVRRPLRAHIADVTDVCWSPDGERLASASVDNTIAIWSVRGEAILTQLKGHAGLVKGVAWDPVGRFLASQSDDRSTIIWRTSDWKQEKVITEPYVGAVFPHNANVFYLRCSWSPCGTQLLTTNGYKQPNADIAAMFARTSGFDAQIDLIGHALPVVSTRFSPRLYRQHAEDADKRSQAGGANSNAPSSSQKGAAETPAAARSSTSSKELAYTCLALGSKDTGISVWQAKGARPFFNMREIFTQEVIDISWGTDGYTLVACSPDGAFVYVRFDPSELGKVVPFDEHSEILTKLWREFGGARDGAPLPETPVQLEMLRSRQQLLSGKPPRGNAPKPTHENGVESSPAASRKDDGSERGFSRARSANFESLMDPAGRASTVAAATEANAKSPASDAKKQTAASLRTPPADPSVLASQKEGRSRGGKRRIIPAAVHAVPVSAVEAPNPLQMSVPDSTLEAYSIAAPQVSAAKRARTQDHEDDAARAEARIGDTGEAQRLNPLEGIVAAKAAAAAAATAALDRAQGASQTASRLRPAHGSGASEPGQDRPSSKEEDPAVARELRKLAASIQAPPPSLYAPSIVGLSLRLLPDDGSGPGRCRALDNETPPTLLESREQFGGSRGAGHIVMCSKGGTVLWRDYFPVSSTITALAGVAGKFAAVVTADASLVFYSAPSGRRLAPPIVLDSSAHTLEAHAVKTAERHPFSSAVSNGGMEAVRGANSDTHENERWFVLVVTRSALCSVFDVRQKRLICARSAASLLARPTSSPSASAKDDASMSTRAEVYRTIAAARVCDSGEPVLLLSDSHAFLYSRDLCAWLRVADDASQNSDFTRGLPAPAGAGLLRSLQAGGASVRKPPTLSGMGDLRRSAIETLAHLESLLESAIALGAAQDYRYYLTCYASRLAAAEADDVEGAGVRLRELCDSLLRGGMPESECHILGMKTRPLLRDVVLPIVAGNMALQRVVSEYVESLDAISAKDATENLRS